MVEGTLIWLEEGLVQPEQVRDAIEDYRRASNPFSEWFRDWVDLRDPAARERSADLYSSYKKFCEDSSVGDREIMSTSAFGRALSDKQLMKGKDSVGKTIRKGCRLRLAEELGLPPGEAGTHADVYGANRAMRVSDSGGTYLDD